MTVLDIWVDHVEGRAKVAVDSFVAEAGKSRERSKLFVTADPALVVAGRGLARLPAVVSDLLWANFVENFDHAAAIIDAGLPAIVAHFLATPDLQAEARANVLAPCSLYLVGWSATAQRMCVTEWCGENGEFRRHDLSGGVTAPFDETIAALRTVWPESDAEVADLAREQVLLGRRTEMPEAFGGNLIVADVTANGVNTRVVCRL